MAQKTIPELQETNVIDGNTMFVIDTGTQTFKVTWSFLLSQIPGGGGSSPIGTVLSFVGDVSPEGYLFCHGQIVQRSEYPILFSLIGLRFGEGDDDTSFRLPDYRGMFLRGVSASNDINDPDRETRIAPYPGGATGNNVGSVQGHAFQSHTHVQEPHGHGKGTLTLYRNNSTANINNSGPVLGRGNNYHLNNAGNMTPMNDSSNIQGSTGVTTAINSPAGAVGPTAMPSENETRSINAYVNYIIKVV